MNNNNVNNVNQNNGQNANNNLNVAQKNTQMRNDANVQSRNAHLSPRGNTSKSSNSVTKPGSTSNSTSRDLRINQGGGNPNLKQRIAGKALNKFGGPVGKIMSNPNALKKVTKSSLVNAIPGVGTASRIHNALSKGKKFFHSFSSSSNDDSDNQTETNDSSENVENEEKKTPEVLSGTVDLMVKIKKYKWFLIGGLSLFSIIFMLCILAGLLTNATAGAGAFANEAKTEDLEKTAEERSKREDVDEFTDVENDVNDNDTGFIDDNINVNVQFVANKLNVTAEDIADYYGVSAACDGKKTTKCTNGDEYRFYLKMYDIYFLYKQKYNVKLDLSYIMAALNYSHEQMPVVLKSNLNEYNREDLKSDDYEGNLSWEFDYKNYEGYTYLNANDNRFDMQILAKNMVTKNITYQCIGGSNNNTGKSKKITKNTSKGDGWNSVTKVKYSNGVERTYRNYKQFNNGNNSYWNYPYSGSNIAGSGCGPTSISIILSGYGYDYNPKDVVQKMSKINITSTSYSTIIQTLKSFNIEAELKSWNDNSEKEIRDNFNAGRPIIVGVTNHFIIYVGLDKNGKLIISDPGKNDGQDAYYGSTISELKSRYGTHQYILIKSDGSASSKKSSGTSSSSTKKSSGSGSGRVVKKSNYNSTGGYSGIYESRTTGKKFKEFKQNSSWAISKFPNVAWKQECGKISALIIGSGYSSKATYANLYKNILQSGEKNPTVHGIIDTYTKTNVDFQSMISISKLKQVLSNGSVASIHISKYPNTSTHYLSILDINKNKTKVYISDPWGGFSYNGWKDISIVSKLGATEICIVPNDNKVVNSSDDADDEDTSDLGDENTNTATDIENSKYDEELKCDGGTLDKDSINATYKLDKKKFKEFLKEFVEHKYFMEGKEVKNIESQNVTGDGSLTVDGTNGKLCKGSVTGGVPQASEPCPNQAILYWKRFLKQENFIFPMDKKTNLPLGAWPKDYAKYPTQLSGYKTYHKYYIWPITPINGTYTTVYTHQSMDIMSSFGTPVYSPVDGTLVYSEWGGTQNRGSDETAYSVTITPSHTVSFAGTAINEIFLTHMSGIRYRCSWGKCNRSVKKGELLGFSGNAAGTSESIGWAPHLHLTFYNKSSYRGTGLYTPSLEKFYGISNKTKRKAGG